MASYDTETWDRLGELNDETVGSADFLELSPDGEVAISRTLHGQPALLDLDTGSLVALVSDEPLWGHSPALTSDVGVVLGGWDGLRLADRATGKTHRVLATLQNSGMTYYREIAVLANTGLLLLKSVLDPSVYPVVAEKWESTKTTPPDTAESDTAEPSPSIAPPPTVETVTDDRFALGLPAGTVLGVGHQDDPAVGQTLILDLHDGSGIAIRHFQALTILSEYVVGSTQSVEGSTTDLVIVDRVTNEANVIPTSGQVEQAAPAGEPDRVWLVERTDTHRLIRLLDLAAGGAEQASFSINDSVNLIGQHGFDPILSANASGAYRLSQEGLEFIGTGQVLAYTGSYGALATCDASLECQIELFGDRSETFPVDHTLIPSWWRGAGRSQPIGSCSPGAAANGWCWT